MGRQGPSPDGDNGRDGTPRKAASPAWGGNASRLRLILVLLGLALAGALGWMALRPMPDGQAPAAAAVGGPFAMVDVDGRPADEGVLKGRWSAIFFGYTYCPDICPATMTALGAAKARLGPAGKDLQTVFVSIDPARDTPAQLKAYLESPAFPRPLVGLTGSPEQVAAMAKAYKVYYAKAGGGDVDYLMDHNSAIYLMDPQGRFVRLVRPDATPEQMAQEISAAMRRS
jgi:protein SCO1/2